MNHSIIVTYGKGFVPVVPLKEKVEKLQEALLQMPQADVKTLHDFEDGKYIRTMIAPPWSVIVGAEHKTPYKVILKKGTIAVNIDDKIVTLTAPLEFDAPAGIKRVGRVFDEEVIWIDIYDNPDNCRDIETIEDRLYIIPECSLLNNRLNLEAKNDFSLFLSEFKITANEMDKIVQIESDLIPMPNGHFVELKDSNLHGKGLFVTKPFDKDEQIAPMRLDGKRTPAGRYINHSPRPNCKPIKIGDDMFVVADKFINVGEELLLNYRDSVKINFGIDLKGEKLCQVQ
jgi:SET domain